MFEVEAKVAISPREYRDLKRHLEKEAKSLGRARIQDTYYGNPLKAFMRIRRRRGTYTFDLKRRETRRGIESNLEIEWGIKDIGKWRRFLRKIDIFPTIRKIKKTQQYLLRGFRVELNEIRGLGHYLEIEKVVPGSADLKEEKGKLVKIFKDLGYNQTQFEGRPYLELLKLAHK